MTEEMAGRPDSCWYSFLGDDGSFLFRPHAPDDNNSNNDTRATLSLNHARSPDCVSKDTSNQPRTGKPRNPAISLRESKTALRFMHMRVLIFFFFSILACFVLFVFFAGSFFPLTLSLV